MTNNKISHMWQADKINGRWQFLISNNELIFIRWLKYRHSFFFSHHKTGTDIFLNKSIYYRETVNIKRVNLKYLRDTWAIYIPSKGFTSLAGAITSRICQAWHTLRCSTYVSLSASVYMLIKRIQIKARSDSKIIRFGKRTLLHRVPR